MNLLGKATDPKFWSETVRYGKCYEKFIKDRMDIWVNDCEGKPITELKYSDFKLFTVNGNRSIYENQYFLRRRNMQSAAVLAMIYPEEQKYLDYLMDIIFAVCDEYTWCIPAHNTALEKNNNTHLDLFATETGFTLAQIYHILGDRLEPLIRDRIRVEIDRRIFTPFTNSGEKYWWVYRGTNNWTSVCVGSIACTTMLMRPELYDSYKALIYPSMERYLSGFGDDGYCLEGVHYWHYGFGFFTTFANMVRTFTNGEVDYFKLPKVKAIATFMQKMFLSGTASVSFADGTADTEYQIGLVHFLAKEYPDDVKVYSPDYSYIEDDCGRFCLVLLAATALDENIYLNPANDNEPAEYYGDNSQWYVKRTNNFGFAAKAGNNAEHHNHNDVGSFVFAKDGKQVLLDLGRGEYTKQYFRNETRYGIIECRSKGHSLPYFGECEQKAGAEYTAKDVSVGGGKFSMDISEAYGLDELHSLKREFTVCDNYVTLSDTFDYTGNEIITERLVLSAMPRIDGGTVTVDGATIMFDPETADVEVIEQPTTTARIAFLLDFHLKAGIKSFSVRIC